MEALRAVLASANADDCPGVASLLALLPCEEFALDVHICSFGGVGSTELNNFLCRHGISTNLLEDKDGMRHLNKPPTYGSNAVPKSVLYIYGDPLASVASHYRRGHAFHQALKTCSASQRLSQDDFPQTFGDYVLRGEDLFGLKEHFQHWRFAPTTFDIIMVRYERMFEPDVCSNLLRLVCGEKKRSEEIESMVESFCRGKRQRQSEVLAEYRQGLYDDLIAEMDNLPPLFVRDKAGQLKFMFGHAA